MSISFSSNAKPCDFRSRKFIELLSGPIDEKSLRQLPGIGKRSAEKFQQTKRFHYAKDLLNEFVQHFRSDDEQFRLWLMKDYAIPEYRATECVMALLNYIDQAKEHQWSSSE